jgi:catechol 2,3-dioxygenase-like lactoylglutathione lyase family enzyme
MNPTTSPNPATGLVIYAKDLRRMTAFYQRTLGLQVVEDDATYAVLQNAQLQLVVQAIPAHIAEQIHIDTPPQAREDTPLKASHLVPSLAAVREAAAATGGVIKPASAEWRFRGQVIVDGLDPEGNVVQFRQAEGA